jgi:uncharacterized Ntn-hydrolase superfamily protein
MTFSLLGRCLDSGQLGAAVTTSDLAVGARVPFAAAGVGVAVTQHRTDPRLGPALLEALRRGMDVDAAVRAVVEGHEHRSWRQLGLLDCTGRAASHTGGLAWPVAGAVTGTDCLAIGNMLVGQDVLVAMVDAFVSRGAARDQPLAARLLAGLQAGERAGGEGPGLRSAALLVVERESFPLVDLRIDDAPDPLTALESLWRAYEPWMRDFVVRALDPDRAPGADRGHESSSTTT